MHIKSLFLFDRTQRTHFMVNVGVGVIITMIFSFTTSTQWGEELMNAAFDLLVRYENHKVVTSEHMENPLFFVEITPAEYKQWGEPLLTPRDHLAALIETAWEKGSPVVVLDILLDRPDPQNQAADTKLRRLLVRMLHENARTQIVFPVRIDNEGNLRHHLFEDLLEQRTGDGRRIFYPAVPTALASEGDLLNRFWGLYQVARNQAGHTEVVWSVPLLAAALHAGSEAHLEKAAIALVATTQHGSNDAHTSGPQINLGNVEIHLPPLLRRSLLRGDHPIFVEGESHGLPYTQRVRFLIHPETRAKRDAGNFRPGLSPDSLAGKIVVIGNGSPETGDILSTPVGRMPGMYFIGNAINTIVTGRMPVHLNAWLHYVAEFFIIVIAALIFLRLHAVLAQILLSAVFLLLFIPLSWYIYREWGLFFNFIIPVAGMRLHCLADDIESMFATRGRKHHVHH